MGSEPGLIHKVQFLYNKQNGQPMKNLLFLLGSSIATLMMIGCGGPPEKKAVNLSSPDSKLVLSFFLTPEGAPVYYLNYQGKGLLIPQVSGLPSRSLPL
jgi:hypothetical protein